MSEGGGGKGVSVGMACGGWVWCRRGCVKKRLQSGDIFGSVESDVTSAIFYCGLCEVGVAFVGVCDVTDAIFYCGLCEVGVAFVGVCDVTDAIFYCGLCEVGVAFVGVCGGCG